MTSGKIVKCLAAPANVDNYHDNLNLQLLPTAVVSCSTLVVLAVYELSRCVVCGFDVVDEVVRLCFGCWALYNFCLHTP